MLACPVPCPLTRLVSLTQGWVPEDWVEECGLVQELAGRIVKQAERQFVCELVSVVWALNVRQSTRRNDPKMLPIFKSKFLLIFL